MAKHTSSQGFALTGIVVIVTVLAVAGFGGWYVWDKNRSAGNDLKSADTTSQNGQNQQPSKPSTTETAKEASDPSEGGKYLVIREWGVRFLLPEELRGDVKYGIAPSSIDDSETAWFEVGRIARLLGSNCTIEPASTSSGIRGGIGVYLRRTSEKMSDDEVRESFQYVSNLSVGGKWYGFGGPKGSCLPNETDETDLQLEVDVARSLTESMKKLEPVPGY